MTTFLDTLAADAKAIWGDVVSVEQATVSRVENGLVTMWHLFTGSVGKFTADEATLINTFVKIAVADVGTGDIGAIQTAVLNLASDSGQTFVADIETPILQGFIALSVSNMPPQAPKAP